MKVLLLSARIHSNNEKLQKNTLNIIHAVGADEDDALMLGKLGALQDTLTVMRVYGTKSSEISAHACHVICQFFSE